MTIVFCFDDLAVPKSLWPVFVALAKSLACHLQATSRVIQYDKDSSSRIEGQQHMARFQSADWLTQFEGTSIVIEHPDENN